MNMLKTAAAATLALATIGAQAEMFNGQEIPSYVSDPITKADEPTTWLRFPKRIKDINKLKVVAWKSAVKAIESCADGAMVFFDTDGSIPKQLTFFVTCGTPMNIFRYSEEKLIVNGEDTMPYAIGPDSAVRAEHERELAPYR